MPCLESQGNGNKGTAGALTDKRLQQQNINQNQVKVTWPAWHCLVIFTYL